MANNTFIKRALGCLERLEKLQDVTTPALVFLGVSALVYALLSIDYELAAARER